MSDLSIIIFFALGLFAIAKGLDRLGVPGTTWDHWLGTLFLISGAVMLHAVWDWGQA